MEKVESKMGSKEYWLGYKHAKSQAERNWIRARVQMNSRFIDIVESAKDVKGIGPKTHYRLVDRIMNQLIQNNPDASREKERIDQKERSRIIKEMANTKWKSLSDEQLIQMKNIVMNQQKQE